MATKKLHIPQYVIVKSPGLLPMLYKVHELANELRVCERTLRDWLTKGAPTVRDGNRIWINGQEFAAWVSSQRKLKREKKLTDSQAYCMRCRQVVEMCDPETSHIKGNLTMTKGNCPKCGCTINRGGRLPSVTTRSSPAPTSPTP